MLESFFIAFALAMDCFAVSVVCGVILRRFEARTALILAFLFGFFQALMPLVGWFLTSRFSNYLQAVDHWIAFGMLAFIGGKMVADAFKEETDASMNPRNGKTQLLLAIATSIDALAVGISYACRGFDAMGQIVEPIVIIGIVSFVMSLLGFSLGVRFGDTVNRKIRPELLGGLILIGIGIRILVEHLSA